MCAHNRLAINKVTDVGARLLCESLLDAPSITTLAYVRANSAWTNGPSDRAFAKVMLP